jgi:thymidylate kinase
VVGAQLALRLGRLARTNVVTRYHRALGRVVLLDRYIVDATLPSADLDWKGRLSAVLVLRTAAAPDRIVFLDAPAEVVFARKGELTIDELRQRRDHYLEMSERFPQWMTVNADRPLVEVLADVGEILWEDLVRSRAATKV